MDILIFNYKSLDVNALNELMHGHLNVISAVECEIFLNFDFYNIGCIETNIIRLNHELIAIFIDYSIDYKINTEDGINWIQSSLVNINYFIDYMDYISI